MSRQLLLVSLLLATGVVLADAVPETQRLAAADKEQAPIAAGAESVAAADEEQAPTVDGAKRISGMSILGNQEAPKSLVIVPWKSSVLGNSLGISTMLDDSRQPIDKEVFMRTLSYYEIRSETTP